MLRQQGEHTLAGSISDVVLLGERMFVALGDALVMLEHGAVVRRFDCAVASLVTSADEQRVLTVSAPIDPREGMPRQRCIHRLSHPWTTLEQLGIVAVDAWCTSFDGRWWPTCAGDDVHVFECSATTIELRARFETFWPYHIERIARGIWVETSSLGACHYEILSLDELGELSKIEAGNLPRCKIDFPAETFGHTLDVPSLGPPLMLVDVMATLLTNEEVHRIMSLDGRVVATVSGTTLGAVATSERALFWFRVPTGVSFILIRRETAEVTARFEIDGASTAGARIFGRDIAVWSEGTLRVLRDT